MQLSLACTKTAPPAMSSGLARPPAAVDTSTRHCTAPCVVSAQSTPPELRPLQAAPSSGERETLVVKESVPYGVACTDQPIAPVSRSIAWK